MTEFIQDVHVVKDEYHKTRKWCKKITKFGIYQFDIS